MLKGDKLGEGTFGIVYSGTSPSTHTSYAIKRNLTEEKTAFIGVVREVDVLSKLRHHPHIVTLERVAFGHPFEVSCFSPLNGSKRSGQRDDDIHFLFKQAAYDLHAFIYGALTIDFAIIKRYMVHMLLGLEYMRSQNIIHRDLKPPNVLVFAEGNVAKICDFGLAKPYTYQGINTPGIATSWYRAPEILLANPNYDYKSDLWSVGCIFYEMIAKRAFMHDVEENDDILLSTILSKLPKSLPTRRFRELIRLNPWRVVKLSPIHSPRVRKSFETQIALTPAGLAQFQREAGSFSMFCDLLTHMLDFDADTRYTVSECLSHVFFADYASTIADMRAKFPLTTPAQCKIIVHDCVERKWMSDAAIRIFNARGGLTWYTHRALFQAMDLFDRYLSVMFHVAVITPDMVESEYKGFIHDKFGAELRFLTCLYLSIKYFSSIHAPVLFESIVPPEYQTHAAKLEAQEFESQFVINCLQYDIYRDTVYEAADRFKDKLDDNGIRDLIVLYSMNNTFSSFTHDTLYAYYRTHLKGKPLESLLLPLRAQQHTT